MHAFNYKYIYRYRHKIIVNSVIFKLGLVALDDHGTRILFSTYPGIESDETQSHIALHKNVSLHVYTIKIVTYQKQISSLISLYYLSYLSSALHNIIRSYIR